MMFCCPVVIEVVEDLNATIHMIKEAFSQKSGPSKELNWFNGPRSKTKLIVS